MTPLRALVVHYAGSANETLSYQLGWPGGFVRNPRIDAVTIDLGDRSARRRLEALARARRRYDVIVLLHSVFSNEPTLHGPVRALLRRNRSPICFFVGNEYKLMPGKMAFAEELGVSLLVSQTDSPRVHALYHERLGCPVTWLPGGGLDPETFRPTTTRRDRPLDLGFRAYEEPPYLGHRSRRRLSEFFTEHAERYGLAVDSSLDERDRMRRDEFASFLNRCKGQISSEAGTDFFELDDDLRARVNAFLAEQPDAGWDELQRRFFDPYPDPVAARMISGRNVEAAGTRTTQIMFEGHYNGLLQPDVHYIPLRQDFANADEAVAQFTDPGYADEIAENAYTLARDELTYERLVDGFVDAAHEHLVM